MNRELKDDKETDRVITELVVNKSLVDSKSSDERKITIKIDKSNKRLGMIDKRIQLYQKKRDGLIGEICNLETSLTQAKITKKQN
jgi:hypothetical protein